MKNASSFLYLAIIFTIFLGFPSVCGAAARQKAAPVEDMAGQKIETDHYSLTMPAGWGMPLPVQKNQAGTTAIFGILQGKLVVTITVIKTEMPIRDMAQQTIANMRRKGIEVGELKEKDGFLTAPISGKAQGELYFGSSGGLRSSISIFGNDRTRANELLSTIEGAPAGLIPSAIE